MFLKLSNVPFLEKKLYNIFLSKLRLKKPYILESRDDLGPKPVVSIPLKNPS